MDNASDNLSTENHDNETESESFDAPPRNCRNGRGRRQKQHPHERCLRYTHGCGDARKHVRGHGGYQLAEQK